MASTACSPIDDEKLLFEAVNTGDELAVRRLLETSSIHVDRQDQYGVTPLQNAAYRGNVPLCHLLLEHRADVNANFHKFNYSTLMFAALSGNPGVTQLILESGADVEHQNSMGKTAAEVASFTSQHQCVALINNFFPSEELSRVLTEDVFLPPELMRDVLDLLRMSNFHPVKVLRFLQECSTLLENAATVCSVLKSLMGKYTKNDSEKFSIRILKIHYFCYVVENASAFHKKNGSVESLVKSFARGRDEDGFQEKAERFIRQCLKEFPHTNMTLFQKIVAKVAAVKIGEHPSALDTITACLAGRLLLAEGVSCDACGDPSAPKTCTTCKRAHYCNKECQKLHWSTHKKFCKTLAAQGIQAASNPDSKGDITAAEVLSKMKEMDLVP